jgi:peptidoglycan/LPS O-acetylase OafA/YrhL
MVITFHVWGYVTETGTKLWERVYATTAGMGWAGVDLFFVLSGFLITGILYDSRSDAHYYRVFYGRRTVRIFPLYYASLALFFWVMPFLLLLLHHPELSIAHDSTLARLSAWTYVINWYEGFKGFSVIPQPLQHFWSLAIEEQFYLVWPFLVLTLARRRLMALCFGLMAFGLTLRVVLYQMHLPNADYTWTLCRADALAIGALLALSARDSRDWMTLVKWAPLVALSALCGIVAVRILNPQSVAGPGQTPSFFMDTLGLSFVGIFFGGCLAMAVCLRPHSLGHRIFGSSFLRFFGKYSYCMYVCHFPIVVFLAKAGVDSSRLTTVLHNEFLAILVVNGLVFTATIAIAVASWNLFEKQWLKLKELPFLRPLTAS